MQKEQIRELALSIISRIAPEAPVAEINPGRRFRDQFQFDSVDFMNFVMALREELKIEIPESVFPKLATLDGCVEYLAARVGN